MLRRQLELKGLDSRVSEIFPASGLRPPASNPRRLSMQNALIIRGCSGLNDSVNFQSECFLPSVSRRAQTPSQPRGHCAHIVQEQNYGSDKSLARYPLDRKLERGSAHITVR